MDILEAIIQYIIAQGLATESDVDIFKDYEPLETDSCIIVNEYAGIGLDTYAKMSGRSVQVVVRDPISVNARNKCWQLFKLLNPEDKVLILDKKPCIIANRNTPIKYKVDKLNRKYFAFNIGVTANYE